MAPQGPQGSWGPCQDLQGGLGDRKKLPKPYPKIGLLSPEALQGGLRQKNMENMFKHCTFPDLWVRNGSKKKLRSRGWNLSGELQAEIPHPGQRRMSKTVGWRTIWSRNFSFFWLLGVPGPASKPLALGSGPQGPTPEGSSARRSKSEVSGRGRGG